MEIDTFLPEIDHLKRGSVYSSKLSSESSETWENQNYECEIKLRGNMHKKKSAS